LEKSFPSPNGLHKDILSVALEAYRTLAGALQIFFLFPLPVASCEHSFNKMKKLKLCMLYTISQDLALLSAENKLGPSIYFSHVVKNLTVKLHICVLAWCYSLLVN
jgi:hypothetical protein